MLDGLDLDHEHGLLEPWLCCELGCIYVLSGCGDHLPTPAMNSISVESDIIDIVSNATHVFVAESSFLREGERKEKVQVTQNGTVKRRQECLCRPLPRSNK